MKLALIIFLATFIGRTKCVAENFAYTKRLFNLSAVVFMKVLNACPYVRSIIFTWKNKQTRLTKRIKCVTKGITFMKRRENWSKLFLDKCIAQNVKIKSVFKFQPNRTVKNVCWTAKIAKAVFTWLIFPIWNTDKQRPYSLEVIHIASLERWVGTTKQKDCDGPPCYKSISAHNNQPQPNSKKKRQKISLYNITVSSSQWFIRLTKVSIRDSFYTISIHSSAVCFFSFQWKNSVVYRIWTKICCSDCKRCRPRNDDELPRIF